MDTQTSMNTDRQELAEALADKLSQSLQQRKPIPALTKSYPDLTLDDAYRIQQINVTRMLNAGEKIIGHKIGLTAKAMQELFGVDEPDYGHITDKMVLDTDLPLDLSRLIDPQIEVEPAFVLNRDLKGPGLTIEDVLDATEYISACFEIIDSRIADWDIRLQDTVADNGSSAFIALDSRKIGSRDFDLRGLHTVLEVDGVEVETGDTTAILGHPANGVAWLANKIAQFGNHLTAGDIVLPGTCTRSYRIAGTKNARGTIEGIGSISLDFVGNPTVVK